MTAVNSLYNYLSSGRQITVRQAKTMFKVANVHDLVYRLRNEGVSIYTNRVQLSDGTNSFAYRLGTPSDSFLRNIATRHLARARKALYSRAINA